jgi:hypothetical protein
MRVYLSLQLSVFRYEDFQIRIPREEVQQIERVVLTQLQKIDPGLQRFLLFYLDIVCFVSFQEQRGLSVVRIGTDISLSHNSIMEQ